MRNPDTTYNNLPNKLINLNYLLPTDESFDFKKQFLGNEGNSIDKLSDRNRNDSVIQDFSEEYLSIISNLPNMINPA